MHISAASCAFLFFGCILSSFALTDIQILNFALNLEYLEATFYSYVATGHGLSAADSGGGPAAIGGSIGELSPLMLEYAADIYSDEIAHVRLLRAALGSAAVPAPLINVGSAFASLAVGKVGSTPSPAFSPYEGDILFLLGAFVFEDVGVTAYKGAARYISNPAYLEVAAGILAVEGYHAGVVRERLYALRDQFIYPFKDTVYSFAARISASNEAAGNVTDFGIADSNGNPILVPGDSNAIPYSRTPAEVLKIVYFGGKTGGGFFPNGLNGDIK